MDEQYAREETLLLSLALILTGLWLVIYSYILYIL